MGHPVGRPDADGGVVMSGPVPGVVPQAWTDLQAYHNAAQVARDQMTDPRAPGGMKDEATDRYCRAVDAVIAELDVLREQRWLGRITILLARKDRV